jgi:hypothetical protein
LGLQRVFPLPVGLRLEGAEIDRLAMLGHGISSSISDLCVGVRTIRMWDFNTADTCIL